MLYSEFVAEYNESDTHKYKLPSADDYHQIIEPIYEFHPADFDKGEIVALYEIGGLAIMKCLKADADKADQIDQDVASLRRKIAELNQERVEMSDEWAPNSR